jgi:hypothetical protein
LTWTSWGEPPTPWAKDEDLANEARAPLRALLERRDDALTSLGFGRACSRSMGAAMRIGRKDIVEVVGDARRPASRCSPGAAREGTAPRCVLLLGDVGPYAQARLGPGRVVPDQRHLRTSSTRRPCPALSCRWSSPRHSSVSCERRPGHRRYSRGTRRPRTSSRRRPMTSSAVHPERRSAPWFQNVILPPRSVMMMASRALLRSSACSRMLLLGPARAPLLLAESSQRALDRGDEPLHAVLDDVVLRAGAQGLDGAVLPYRPREEDERRRRVTPR